MDAYQLGRAYALGKAYALGRELAELILLVKQRFAMDSILTDPFWITLSNGHHVEITPMGIVTKGRFKGLNVRDIPEKGRVKKTKRKNSQVTPLENRYIYFRAASEIKGVKEEAALNKLYKAKKGFVKGAFKRDDLGEIDIPYGDDYAGLKHIKEREHIGSDQEQFIKQLSDTIKNGDVYRALDQDKRRGRIYIAKPISSNRVIFVTLSEPDDDRPRPFLITAMEMKVNKLNNQYRKV